MVIDHTGETVIVTGAGRGIGREIAYHFADAGADVVAAARTESEIEETVAGIEERGSTGLAVPTDLREPAEIVALVDAATDHFGTLDVLVNNAAVHVAGDPLSRSVEDIDAMLGVNLRGVFLLSQAFANAVIDGDGSGGSIVNISSIVGHLSVPAMPVYCGTKAGVYGLTRGLAGELAHHGINVNAVSPGLTRVERIERLLEEKGELYEIDAIPLGRLGEPEDIANAVLYLTSDLASYVTGVDLPVDGGAVRTSVLYRDQYLSE
ncbi:SDR family NAD(P)-dependent oxidoreductase [Halomicroarcula sp. GCM10025324]|uniref:SDR family NAD(P)-dependent oxidoreductase n=1 Tax=Haloarcula TaxID=2237 RepID=UPI0023E8D76F|nr:SDR family oxidoreductase [Halomicroarcula sp. ZS-22-S1]